MLITHYRSIGELSNSVGRVWF